MKSRWFTLLLFVLSSAALAQSHTDLENRFPIASRSKAPRSKKPPKNPVISTPDKQKKKLWLNKKEKFYPLKGSPKVTPTPMNKLPKPGAVSKPKKGSKLSSLYADPSK